MRHPVAEGDPHQAGLPDNLKTEEVLDLIFRALVVPFPALEAKEHRRIGDLVQASNLLEQAKRRVEELIEQEAG